MEPTETPVPLTGNAATDAARNPQQATATEPASAAKPLTSAQMRPPVYGPPTLVWLDDFIHDAAPEVPSGFGDTAAPPPDDTADWGDRSPSPLGRRDRFEDRPRSAISGEAFIQPGDVVDPFYSRGGEWNRGYWVQMMYADGSRVWHFNGEEPPYSARSTTSRSSGHFR